VDTAGCVLQGDVRTKVKTPGTGKNMVEEAVQTPLFPVQGHAWSPTMMLEPYDGIIVLVRTEK
jgi:hypothetical protein